MALLDFEKALVQVLLAKHLVEENTLLEDAEKLKIDFPTTNAEPLDLAQMFTRMNKNLKRSGLEVRTVIKREDVEEDDGGMEGADNDVQTKWVKYHGLANIEEDFVSKEFGSSLDEDEVKLFADLIPHLLEKSVMNIEDCERANTTKIQKSRVSSVLKKLHEEGWLGRESNRGYWELGIRSYLELKAHFESILLSGLHVGDDTDAEKLQQRQNEAKDALPQVILY